MIMDLLNQLTDLKGNLDEVAEKQSALQAERLEVLKGIRNELKLIRALLEAEVGVEAGT
jgi:hypothetical protein